MSIKDRVKHSPSSPLSNSLSPLVAPSANSGFFGRLAPVAVSRLLPSPGHASSLLFLASAIFLSCATPDFVEIEETPFSPSARLFIDREVGDRCGILFIGDVYERARTLSVLLLHRSPSLKANKPDTVS